MEPFIHLPGCRIVAVSCEQGKVHIKAGRKCKTATCPACGKRSGSVHSRYTRLPADLPLSEHRVNIELEVRRFRCGNPQCQKKTFAERFPDVVLPYAQRTLRLAKVQTEVAIKVGGEVGSDLLGKLNMPSSGDTLLRLIRKVELPEHDTPKVLGVDDWSFRRGKIFGTILVDLEKHQVVDLLEERTSDVLADWLQKHPGVEIISRDRSAEYARGANEGAPEAKQVADRWHLLKNLGDCLKDWLERQHKHLKRDKATSQEVAIQQETEGQLELFDNEKIYFGKSMAQRQALFEEAARHIEQGLPVFTTAKKLGLARTTLRRWLAKGAHSISRQKFKPLEPFIPYLEQRWREGMTNRKELFRELISQGFAGSYFTVYHYTNEVIGKVFSPQQTRQPIKAKRYTLLENLQLFSKKVNALDDDEVRHLEHITSTFPEAKVCYDFVQRFHKLVRKVEQHSDHALDIWLKEVKQSTVIELQRFANGLEQDRTAVVAALTSPWSNGQTEGQVNKLKLIKRQMYGRGKFDLLRWRVLLN
jgi:transposase